MMYEHYVATETRFLKTSKAVFNFQQVEDW